MAKINPVKFFREVRQEARKVTWPTRKETMVSTVMVLIIVALASALIMLFDSVIAFGVELILGIGG